MVFGFLTLHAQYMVKFGILNFACKITSSALVGYSLRTNIVYKATPNKEFFEFFDVSYI